MYIEAFFNGANKSTCVSFPQYHSRLWIPAFEIFRNPQSAIRLQLFSILQAVYFTARTWRGGSRGRGG